MNIHRNARLTPLGRERLIQMIGNGMSHNQAALACGVSAKTAAQWYRRFKSEGLAGLQDRSSRPRKLRASTPEHVCDYIIALRRQRLTAAHIAAKTGVSPATVSRVLRRAGLSRLRDLEPAEPVRRYERDHPGDMIHLDIKRLGKFDRIGHRITGSRTGQSTQRSRRAGPGWEYVHVCVDDASRLSFTQIHPDEKAVSAVAHLRAALAWYVSMGVKVSRVMTDNGSCYKSHAFKSACTELGIRHVRTKPYTPQTNGKAERFIQTALREWAYARAYLSRYTHRIAISNSRLIGFDERSVTFRVKDYRINGPGRHKTMTLKTDEFIRRFLIHVLPKGQHRIRHYGFYGNGNRAANIARIRRLLGAKTPDQKRDNGDSPDKTDEPRVLALPCPGCGGQLTIIDTIAPAQYPRAPPTTVRAAA